MPDTATPTPPEPDPKKREESERKAAQRKAVLRELATFRYDLVLRIGSRGAAFCFVPILPGDDHAIILWLDPVKGERRELRLGLGEYKHFAQAMLNTLQAADPPGA